MTTDEWGIQAGYHDVEGRWRTPSEEARTRLRAAMGDHRGQDRPLRVVRPGEAATVGELGAAPATLVLEDGTELALRDHRLPPDLPLGYHQVRHDCCTENLIVAPPRAHLPAWTRAWGVTAQLYAARSSRSWGMGDLRDLRQLARWAEGEGASTIGLNPLHASSPGAPPANSPYSPSSRRWRDPIYLDVEAVLGAAGLAVASTSSALGSMVEAGRALGEGDAIDRAATWQHKLAALEAAWDVVRSSPGEGFVRYLGAHGQAIVDWGTSCAIAEVHGANWRQWPAGLRHPEAPAVARFGADRHDRVRFWMWLQWLFDEQLDAAGVADLVVTDLAVGFDPNGFDAWQWQDLLADGVHIGAPPDLLGPAGQDWGLPPFVPWRLRSAGYQPFAQTLRANLGRAAGLRIDHVMGLLRLFWIPPGMTAHDGAYVRWTGSELLDVVALESVRAGAFVVGEDLGTVEPGVREELAERGVLGTRLLWFEDDAPSQWPHQTMAAVSTHDLPTVAGVWSGIDLADQRAAGVVVPDDGDEAMRHRLRVAAHADDTASVDDIVVAAHAAIASSPCRLATASLDDLLGAVHRPNVPGTIDEHPNWRIPLPEPIDALDGHRLATAVAAALRPGRTPAGDG